MPVRLIASRQLNGDYGTPSDGEEFETDEVTARSLESRGLARRKTGVTYSTKVITPEAPQVSARQPFLHAADSDQEPAVLATVRDSVRAVSDVQKPGDSDNRRRPGRVGPDSK